QLQTAARLRFPPGVDVVNGLIVPPPPLPQLLFIVTTRQPPSATLFPYTTLFRSRCPARTDAPHGAVPRGGRRPGAASCAQSRRRDRKSTRLNSSHVAISYAVLCLKKKTFMPPGCKGR